MAIGDAAFGNGDIMRRLKALEDKLREQGAGRRLENATVGAGGVRVKGEGGITLQNGGDLTVEDGGGLTIKDSGVLRADDDNGVARFFVGQIDFGGGTQPVVLIRDAAAEPRFGIYDPNMLDGYQPVLWMFDHLGNIVFTTDINGGMAEPWIPVPMYPRAWPSAFLDATSTALTLPVSACNGGSVWEGRIGKVSHPRIQFDFVAGRVTGASGVPTYQLVVGGEVLEEFSTTSHAATLRGPFDISERLGQTNVAVELKVSAVGTGTDRVAASMLGTWMRQT